MKNVLMVVAMFFTLFVCWLTLREVGKCNEKLDKLLNEYELVQEDDTLKANPQPKVETAPVETKITDEPKKNNQQTTQPRAKAQEIVSAPKPSTKKVVNKNDITITQFKKDNHDNYEIVTFKNNTDDKISRIEGIIVYKDMSGNDISYNEIDVKVLIAPGMSKQTKIRSFDQDNKYCYYKEFQSYMDVVGVSPFKIEFRLTSYN